MSPVPHASAEYRRRLECAPRVGRRHRPHQRCQHHPLRLRLPPIGWTGLGAAHVLPGHDGPDVDLVPTVRPACEVRMHSSTPATPAGEMAGSPDSPVPAALWPPAAGVGNGHRPDAAPSTTTFTPPTTHQPPGTAGVTPFRVTNDLTPSPQTSRCLGRRMVLCGSVSACLPCRRLRRP
jgi:hypothetical protein